MKEKQNKLSCEFLMTTSFKFNFTLFMLLFAFVLYVINPNKARELCLFAVFFSTLGDLALMNYNNIPNIVFYGKHFFGGMAFFAVAHILYCLCFSYGNNFSFFHNFNDGSYFIIAFWILFAHIMGIVTYHTQSTFKIAMWVYSVCVLSSMLAISTIAYEYGGKYIFVTAGIIMFFVSDFLILVREKVNDTERIRKAIWIFYSMGQLLIIYNV